MANFHFNFDLNSYDELTQEIVIKCANMLLARFGKEWKYKKGGIMGAIKDTALLLLSDEGIIIDPDTTDPRQKKEIQKYKLLVRNQIRKFDSVEHKYICDSDGFTIDPLRSMKYFHWRISGQANIIPALDNLLRNIGALREIYRPAADQLQKPLQDLRNRTDVVRALIKNHIDHLERKAV